MSTNQDENNTATVAVPIDNQDNIEKNIKDEAAPACSLSEDQNKTCANAKNKVKIRGLYNSARAASASKDAKNQSLEEQMQPWQTEDVGTFLGISKRVWAVWFGFISCGLLYSQFTSRLPALTSHLGVDHGGIGLLITCFAGGSLLGLISSGFILRLIQSKHALRFAILCFMGIMVGISFIYNYKIALIVFALWGFSCAFVDVVMNSQAMYLEINTKKHYMGRMHANYSLGCVLGSGIAAVFAHFNLDLAANYISVAVLTLILFIAFSGKLYQDPPKDMRKQAIKANKEEESQEAQKLLAQRPFIPFFVLLCGVMSLLSYTAEGSVAEWGSLVMFNTKGSTEAMAALAYGVLAFTMAVARFGVDKLRSMFKDNTLILGGALMAAICMLVVIYTRDPIICLISYAIMGIGLAPISPIAFSRAGTANLVAPKTAATLVGMIGYGGFLVIPPAIGYLANYVGLANAMFLPVMALVIVMIASRAFRVKSTPSSNSENLASSNNEGEMASK